MRDNGALRGNAHQREGRANTRRYDTMRYPLRNPYVVTIEAIKITLGEDLRKKCVCNFRHVQIENETRDENVVGGSDPDLKVGTSGCSAPDNGDADAHNMEWRHTHLPSNEIPLSPSSTLAAGAGKAEAFFRELL